MSVGAGFRGLEEKKIEVSRKAGLFDLHSICINCINFHPKILILNRFGSRHLYYD